MTEKDEPRVPLQLRVRKPLQKSEVAREIKLLADRTEVTLRSGRDVVHVRHGKRVGRFMDDLQRELLARDLGDGQLLGYINSGEERIAMWSHDGRPFTPAFFVSKVS